MSLLLWSSFDKDGHGTPRLAISSSSSLVRICRKKVVSIQGKLVIVDGMDGCGKGTIVTVLKNWAIDKNYKVFDLREYWENNHSLPEIEDLEEYDVIVSAEPTFSLVGSAIRDELIRDNKREYSALTTAQAFSIDRAILYKRIIIPALKLGKHVFQERSVTTSIVFQPIQAEKLELSQILALEGNQIALKNRPDLLILLDVKPEIAIKRLQGRDKNDEAIFEKLEFQKKVHERYTSDWFTSMFEKLGSKVVFLDANGTVEEAKEQTLKIWEEFLAK
jgi:dTMP kinase